MKVAVVGAGIFGCTAAVELARAGHSVTLFDKAKILLAGASGHNQFRLHRGYHYPRSPETGRACRDAMNDWPGLALSGTQLYAIAKEGSRVSAAAYLKFLEAEGLPHRAPIFSVINRDTVDLVIESGELRYDPYQMRLVMAYKLAQAGVAVRLDTKFAVAASSFDCVVLAVYAATPEWTGETFQFELVEKPVLWLHPDHKMQNTGIVIMDGPFCSLDPFGTTGLHVMGHVEYAIHERNVGTTPEVWRPLRPYVNAGVIYQPKISYAKRMMEDGQRFIPALKDAIHVGSMFTVRAVLPNMDATDARPTTVKVIDEKTVRIFSGKIPTCVTAAREVRSILDKQDGRDVLAA